MNNKCYILYFEPLKYLQFTQKNIFLFKIPLNIKYIIANF